MNETILQYWNRMKQYWEKINRTQRITIIAIIVLSLVSIPIIVYSFSKTEYSLAFTDLQPSDAASITQYLESANVSYKLTQGGKNISVPTKQVDKVKLDVVSQGLNKNGAIGYDSLKSNSMFGQTDKEFDITKLSMIQGELQQLINNFDSVASSKVLITLPEQSAFARPDDKEQASAAVILQLKQGYTLDQAKIDTMYSLVSKSVKNLPTDNITISDQYGTTLPYSKADGSQVGLIANQVQVKKQFEQDLQRNISSLLSRIIGPGKVIPMVVANFNFDKKKTNENLVTPVDRDNNKGIEISVQDIQKSYVSDGGSTTGGVPGTGQSDVPNYPGGAGTSGKTTSEDTQRTVNLEVNHINNVIESQPYYINDLTISVGVEPPNPNDPNSLSQETKNAIQQTLVNLVRSSLANSGTNLSDADLSKRVTVFSQPFAANAASAANKPTNWMLVGGIGLLAALIAGGTVLVVTRRRRAAAAAAAMEAELAGPPKIEFPTIDIDNVSRDSQVRKQLESLAKKKPEEFVNLLRTWLVDE